MGYMASNPEFRAYEENVFVATGGEKILPFRPADGFILVKNRQIQYPTVDWFINTDGKAELKTAAAVGDTFLIINLASFLISGCATKDEIAEAANKPKLPLFDLTWRPSRASILDGTVPADGDTYSRATYPDAFAAIQAGLVPVCTDAEWLADPSKHGFYTLGDGSTTFRVPDYNGKKTDAIASVVLRGDGKNAGSFGQIQQDCIRNITGSFGGISNSPSRTWPIGVERLVGCFRGSGGAGSYDAGPIASSQVLLPSLNSDAIFEASRVVPTGPENRMTNVAGVWCIRLFNGRVLDGNINLPSALDSKQDKHPYLESYVQPYAGIRFKNIVQNPKMLVSQRGDTITLPVNDTLGTIDRFNVGNSTVARGTVRRITTGAQLDGYDSARHWMRVTPNATALTYPIPSRKHMRIAQCVETMECRQLYGVPTTLSFLVKSSVAGIFSVAFRNGARNKTYISEYTIKAAGVSQVVEVKLPSSLIADLQINWGEDNGVGVEICWPVAVASDLKSSTVNSVLDGDLLGGPNFNSSWGASTSDYFDITMVQWEVGTSRTSFEHRPYNVEYLMCARYLVGAFLASGTSSTVGIGGMSTGVSVVASYPVPAPIRAKPTWEGGTLHFMAANTAGNIVSIPVFDWSVRGDCYIYLNSNTTSGLLVGSSSYLDSTGVNTGFRGWNAELV